MSEMNPVPDATTPAAPAPTGPAQQAGAMLRQAREQAGLHVAALAVALKVPVKKLEALEAGRFELLPDMAFARGLAASICRGLKIDPKPVLDLMPSIITPQMAVAPPAINARFEPGGAGAGPGLRGSPTPAMWAVLVLLLGALAIYLWPGSSTEPADAQETATSAGTPLATPGMVTESVTPAEPAVAPAPATPIAVVPVLPVVPASGPAPVPAESLLRFVAKTETWVQVTDATGKTPLRRSLAAGETVAVDGTPPLAVVIGRVDALESVQVRGQTFDLRAVARNNIARFEVK